MSCFFLHKWEYEFDSPYTIRKCKKCLDKERTLSLDISLLRWDKCELTIQESRHKKLKELGI